MASTVYADRQQLCDYALLKHVDVGKDADAPDKLYKKWTKLWVVLHCEISPLDCFIGYCKKESKWLVDNQTLTKYPLHTVTPSLICTKKHENVLQLEFPSQTLQLAFDSQTKMDHYYQLLNGVSVRHHVDLVRAPQHPEKEGDYVIEQCPDSYKAWKTASDGRGRLCWEWHLKCIRRIQFHKNVEKLEVEAGRMAETGEGHFYFTGRHAQRLFEAMKDMLLSRAVQRQQMENKSLPHSQGPAQVNLSRSKSLSNSPHSSNYQHPVSNRVLPSRPVASSGDSETSSEEYSPSDNSSYTGGSARDWPILPYTPSPTPGSVERAPPLPPRDQRLPERDMYSPSSSSSSSAGGYQFPRQVIHPTPDKKPHYMKVDRGLMDTDSEYMTMSKIGFQKLNVADDDDPGYTDMRSAGKVGPLYDSTPEDIPPEFVEQFSRVFPNSDHQNATLTRNHSEPLLELSSSPPPPLPPHASLRLREPDPNLINGSPSSNTFPGTRRT